MKAPYRAQSYIYNGLMVSSTLVVATLLLKLEVIFEECVMLLFFFRIFERFQHISICMNQGPIETDQKVRNCFQVTFFT